MKSKSSAYTGHNFWLECPTDLKSTPLSYIFKALFRQNPTCQPSATLDTWHMWHMWRTWNMWHTWRDIRDTHTVTKYIYVLRHGVCGMGQQLCKCRAIFGTIWPFWRSCWYRRQFPLNSSFMDKLQNLSSFHAFTFVHDHKRRFE